MQGAAKPLIDSQRTVNETVRLFPATIGVFARAGIDTCCGGGLSVEEAARRHRLDLGALTSELERAAAV
jgi:iron-sulfur cluster repair protein YtfE (RIC family)